MWNGLVQGDPSGQILTTWIAEEQLPHAPCAGQDRRGPAGRRPPPFRFNTWCATSGIPELQRLAGTIDAWWPEVLGSPQIDVTDAGTEATNRTVTPPALPTASATWTTNAAEYGSPAPSATAGLPPSEGHAPQVRRAAKAAPPVTHVKMRA